MSSSTLTIFLRQGEQSQEFRFSETKAVQLKQYREGIKSMILVVEDIHLAVKAFLRLIGVYSPLEDLDWKTRLNLFIFQEKFFLTSEKELLDFQVPSEQFQEFLTFCDKEKDILYGKISFTSHLKNLLEIVSHKEFQTDSSPDVENKKRIIPIISVESPCAFVEPVEPIIPDEPVEPIIPDEPVEPIIPDEPPVEPIIPDVPPVEPIIPDVPPTMPSRPKAYRLKPTAPFSEVVFSYRADNGETSVVKTTKNKTPANVTKIRVVDSKAYARFIVYLEADGGVFVRKFEDRALGKPVLLTAGTDCVELKVSSDGKHLMLFDRYADCHVASVDLEKGEVLNSFSLCSTSSEYILDPNGDCYTIDWDNLSRPNGTSLPVEYLVKAGNDKETRRIISPLSEYVVAALTHSKVVVSEADGSYVVYDNELNKVNFLSRRDVNDSYLWSGSLGNYCVLLLRGNKVNQCQFFVYNAATNIWTVSLEKKENKLKLLKNDQLSAYISLLQLEDGTPVIVTCSQAKKYKLVISSLPTEDRPKVKVLFKQKMEKINGRNESPVDISIF